MAVTVVFYISGHGFGHASRDIEVIRALLARRRDVKVVARTRAARWLFERTVGVPADQFELAQLETDTGVVQIDSLHPDEPETVRHARAFMRTFEARVAAEAAFLEEQHAVLAVADIPPLGVAAASRAGIPAVALGNFTWDWIYSGYDDASDLVEQVGAAYAVSDVAFRLPMHGGFDSFPRIVDVPFIARRSHKDPQETRERLGLPAHERLVLVSFGGFGLDGLDYEALTRLDGCVALVGGSLPLGALPRPLQGGRRGSLVLVDEPAMYEAGLRYEDLVRAVDAVVTKPGYGIIAECVANDTALLYTSRGRFIEYDILVREMPRYLRARFIGHRDLFAGAWSAHLAALFAQGPPPARPRVDGADVVAERLLAMI